MLGPLLFLLCENDLSNSSNVLVPIMFADDTNSLFFLAQQRMVLSKQGVTKCRKKQVFVVPYIGQKIQHPLSSTNVKN